MSHFVVCVAVPSKVIDEGDKAVENFLEDVMEPYSEHKIVEPYERECWCVGFEQQRAVRDAYYTAHGSIAAIRDKVFTSEKLKKELHKVANDLGYPSEDDARKAAHEIYRKLSKAYENRLKSDVSKKKYEELLKEYHAIEDPLDAVRDRHWEEIIGPYQKNLEQALENAKPYFPRKGCSDCDGTGVMTMESNPDGKWDWYEIGGRWDRELTEHITGELTHLKGNSLPMTEYLALLKDDEAMVPFSILDGTGLWHEKGRMLMFAQSDGEMTEEEWKAQIIEHLTPGAETHHILAVDCHT